MLALQNEIQQYYLDTEGIPKYVNALEDSKNQSKRAGNYIEFDTLLIIATKVMLSNESFPWAEEIWEDLSKYKKDWSAWKKLYKADGQRTKVKKQSIGSQDQFGTAHGALRHAPQTQQVNGMTRLASDLDEYFDALSAAATTEKGVLEELVKYNSTLTTTNAELSAAVDSLIKANYQLSLQLGNRRNNRTCEDYSVSLPKTLCLHCKTEVMHAPNNGFKLEKNLRDTLGGGKVVCDDGGHLK